MDTAFFIFREGVYFIYLRKYSQNLSSIKDTIKAGIANNQAIPNISEYDFNATPIIIGTTNKTTLIHKKTFENLFNFC